MTNDIRGTPATMKEAASKGRSEARKAEWGKTAAAILKNPLTVAGLAVIGFLLVVAAFAPLLATHNPISRIFPKRSGRRARRIFSGPTNSEEMSTVG